VTTNKVDSLLSRMQTKTIGCENLLASVVTNAQMHPSLAYLHGDYYSVVFCVVQMIERSKMFSINVLLMLGTVQGF